jgi:hypothetical protein
MVFRSFVLISMLSLFSACTDIEKEAKMLAEYCYCQTTKAKTEEQKNLAKRTCNDMKNQIEKQHGKDLKKATEDDKLLFKEAYMEQVHSCE